MKTDIEIAQEAAMLPIKDVAASIGVEEDDLELYGKYKAKFSDEYLKKVQSNPNGKLVLSSPRSIRLQPAKVRQQPLSVGRSIWSAGKKAVIALREPSLGPCFGIKGGAAGGGYAQVVPMEDLKLHFTGDFHAITSANNLLAAMMDNHIQQGNALDIDTRQIIWKRCLDMNDRVLRNVVVGLGNKMDGVVREDHFVITVASEIMAILCLADDMEDLKHRLGKDYCCLQPCRRTCYSRRSECGWCYGSTPEGCVEAESDPDPGTYTGHRPRRTICQYRSWLQ